MQRRILCTCIQNTHTHTWGRGVGACPKLQTFVDEVKDLKMEIFSMKHKGPYKNRSRISEGEEICQQERGFWVQILSLKMEEG